MPVVTINTAFFQLRYEKEEVHFKSKLTQIPRQRVNHFPPNVSFIFKNKKAPEKNLLSKRWCPKIYYYSA